MQNIVGISDSIKNLLPKSRLGVVKAKVNIEKTNSLLNDQIDHVLSSYGDSLTHTRESKLEIIEETRSAYKILGKEPSRYRPSAEALLRRVRTGKDLYRINNVVDTINLLSMESTFSIGGFDMSNISGKAILDIGDSNPYKAIGRGELNIEFMPGMKDDLGFFGTPTSDSERTMVTSDINELLLVYYDFYGNSRLSDSLSQAVQYLELYCNAKDIAKDIIA